MEWGSGGWGAIFTEGTARERQSLWGRLHLAWWRSRKVASLAELGLQVV